MAKKKRTTKRRRKTTTRTTRARGGAGRTRAPRKRALLIGVNRYKVPGADLRGCVNDVENVEDAITRYCGFSSRDIRKLTDFRATTARMRDGISTLVDDARPGDVVFLHFSGHGSNVPDRNGDEADRRDEILCPTDLDWYDPLLDDWLRDRFADVPAGTNLTVIFDCCHSGTATRAFLPPDAPTISRFLPCPLDLMAAESGRSLRGTVRSRRRRRTRSSRSRDVTPLNTPEVLISGCRDDQTSADARIRGDYHGALSYHLAKALRAKRGRLTYRELHRETARLVKRGRYTQVPQLSGKSANLDRVFLAPYV